MSRLPLLSDGLRVHLNLDFLPSEANYNFSFKTVNNNIPSMLPSDAVYSISSDHLACRYLRLVSSIQSTGFPTSSSDWNLT